MTAQQLETFLLYLSLFIIMAAARESMWLFGIEACCIISWWRKWNNSSPNESYIESERRRHKMEWAIDHRCPRCQSFQETLAHVFQCPSAVELCRKALIKAQATIWKKPTCKFVVTTLVSGISQWSTGAKVQWSWPIPGPADDITTLAFKAFQEQQDICWDQAIRGRISKSSILLFIF